MRRMPGFTLIEIMITIVIVAIIAAVAIPNYTDYITRSKFAEAHAQLADYRVKMEQYYMDNRRYSTVASTTAAVCGAAVPTGTKYFDDSCVASGGTAAGAQQFVLTAAGRSDQGLDGISYTLNHANARSTTVTAASAMAKKGYTAATTACWVSKKPAQC